MLKIALIAEASELFSVHGLGAYGQATKIAGSSVARVLLVHEATKLTRFDLQKRERLLAEYAINDHLSFSDENQLTFFLSRNNVLDNMSALTVFMHGREWRTAEHAYQAAKFTQEDIVERIATAKSPYDAKDYAKIYFLCRDSNWSSRKVAVMRRILFAKADQHEMVRKVLLESGNRQIVEDSSEDAFWGRGPDFNGKNQMGQLWQEVRQSLRSSKF